jgi:hypothetical protein
MAFNFFTAFHNAMMDPAAYASFSKEMNLKAVEQVFFNSLAGKLSFDAVVLPEDINSSKVFDGKRAVRIRPLGIHDFIIPEPCSFTDPNTIKTVLSLHPVAYPDNDVPLIEQPEGAGQVSFNSRIVECFFKNGPQSSGKLRGLTYRLRRESSVSVNINTDCLGGNVGNDPKSPTETQRAFKRGDYKQYEKPSGGETSPGVLKVKTEAAKKYVKESTGETNETSDRKKYSPSKKTYIGKASAYKDKSLENGLLPEELIKQSNSATGAMALFLVDVIDDFDRLAQAFHEKFNQKLSLTVPSYRTFNEQIRIKNQKIKAKKPTEAAPPGTSNHGWGLAFDFDTHYKGKSGFQSETFDWMMRNAPRFGFHSPPILRDGAGTDEAWHFEWMNKNNIWRD